MYATLNIAVSLYRRETPAHQASANAAAGLQGRAAPVAHLFVGTSHTIGNVRSYPILTVHEYVV